MPKRHHKSAHLSAKAAAPRTPKAPSTTPVEAEWLKFADKFRAFQRTPNNDDKENDRPWEAALNVANRAAYAVIGVTWSPGSKLGRFGPRSKTGMT
jgi:hypothetical protein